MFEKDSVIRGRIDQLGGYEGLIPGMIVGQAEFLKNGDKNVTHGGVYAGYMVLEKGKGPVHAVYQSVAPGTNIKGKEGGPVLNEMNDKWNVWMLHDGVILDY